MTKEAKKENTKQGENNNKKKRERERASAYSSSEACAPPARGPVKLWVERWRRPPRAALSVAGAFFFWGEVVHYMFGVLAMSKYKKQCFFYVLLYPSLLFTILLVIL